MGFREMSRECKILFIAIILLASVSVVDADMNAATPQAASFATVDRGGPSLGGDLAESFSLLTVSGRNSINVPVSLNYLTSNAIPRKESTEVGFGFSLGAAGAITRSVNGVPDDMKEINVRRDDYNCAVDLSQPNPYQNAKTTIMESGWLVTAAGMPNPQTGTTGSFSERNNIQGNIITLEQTTPSCSILPVPSSPAGTPNVRYTGIIQGVVNGNPDYFYVSMNGQGSEMILDQMGNFRQSNVKPWLIRYTCNAAGKNPGIAMTYTNNMDCTSSENGITQFTVTDENGNSYVFKDIGARTSTQKRICDSAYDANLLQISQLNDCLTRGCGLGCDKIINTPDDPHPELHRNGYTYAWPLVYILSSNYVDKTGDGPSVDDDGDWAKLDYSLLPTVTRQNQDAYVANYPIKNDFMDLMNQYIIDDSPQWILNDAMITSTSTIVPYVLTTITTPVYKADFSYADRTGYDDSVGSKLDKITLKQNTAATGIDPSVTKSTNVLKTVKLDYYTGNERLFGFMGTSSYRKLTLKSITEYGEDANGNGPDAADGVLPSTDFTYYNPSSCTENNFGLCTGSASAYLLKTVTYPTGSKATYGYSFDQQPGYFQTINLNAYQNFGIIQSYFIDTGTKLDQISFDDNDGSTSITSFSYYGSVMAKNPFCEIRTADRTQDIYCIIPRTTGYQESDIGGTSANSVTYSRINKYYDQNGYTSTFYTSARDYPNLCNENKVCLTEIGYQYGRPMREITYSSVTGPVQNRFMTYTQDDQVPAYPYTYSENKNKIQYKIAMIDWSHVRKQSSTYDIWRDDALLVPTSRGDTYYFVSGGTFPLENQVVDLTSSKNMISDTYYYYEDGMLPSSSGVPQKFNGMPRSIRERLAEKNQNGQTCVEFSQTARTLPIPLLTEIAPRVCNSNNNCAIGFYYYKCPASQEKETVSNYAFEIDTNVKGRHMLLQPGIQTLNERITIWEDCGGQACNGLSTTIPLTQTKTSYALFNGNQVYPSNSMIWNDKNKDKKIDASEFVTTTFNAYDSYGNNLQLTTPTGTSSFAEYDSVFHKYPTKNWNSVMGSSTNPVVKNTFDQFGNVKTITDVNSKITTYNFDSLARLTGVQKPNDQAPSQVISYCYARDASCNQGNSYNFVSTQSVLAPGKKIMKTSSYADGEGKVKQTAAIESATSTIYANNEYYVTGKIKKEFKPVRENSGQPAGTTLFKNFAIVQSLNTQMQNTTAQVPKTSIIVKNSTIKNATSTSKPAIKLPITGAATALAGGGELGDGGDEGLKIPVKCINNDRGCIGGGGGGGSSIMATLKIRTPGVQKADIYIDDEYAGYTNPTDPTVANSFTVIAGQHRITAKKTDYKQDEKWVSLIYGQTLEVNLNLVYVDPTKGYVNVITDPSGATIFVDDEATARGTSPVSFNLNAGQHTIRAELARYQTTTVPIKVVAKQESEVQIALSKFVIAATTYKYEQSPLLRIKEIDNPDNTVITNEYSTTNEPVTVNGCFISNPRACITQPAYEYDDCGLMRTDDYCRYDTNGGCPSIAFPRFCEYSCTGTTSAEGCQGTTVQGTRDAGTSIPCTRVDIVRSKASPNTGCDCYYLADGPTYYDGSFGSQTTNRDLLLTKTHDQIYQATPSKGTTIAYSDRAGKLVKSTDTNNKDTVYEYDIAGRPTKITNALGIITTNEYNTLGKLMKTTNPDYGEITYKYDDNGNMLEKARRPMLAVQQQNKIAQITTTESTMSCTVYPINIFLFSNAPAGTHGYAEGDATAWTDMGPMPVQGYDLQPLCFNHNMYSFGLANNGVALIENVHPGAMQQNYIYLDNNIDPSTSGNIYMTDNLARKLFLDNVQVLDMPTTYGSRLTALGNIAPGQHAIKYEFADGTTQTFNVNNQPGQGWMKDMTLYVWQQSTTNTGGVSITTNPERLDVTIQSKGAVVRSPVNIRNIPAGSYTFYLTDYPNVRRTISVVAGQTTEITLDQTAPIPGMLNIATNLDPGVADIFVNGEPKGKSPKQIEVLAGTYSVKASAPGYDDQTVSVSVAEGQTVPISFVMREKAEITTYTYDGLNRVKTVTFSNGDPAVSYTYDSCTYSFPNPLLGYNQYMNPSNAKGRLCKVSNGFITKEFSYDDRGRVWRELYTIDGKAYYLTYTYDSNDNLVSITNSASQNVVMYDYNSLNQVEKVHAGGSTFNVEYNPEGTIKTLTYPLIPGTAIPAGSISYEYDANNRMTLFNIKTGASQATTLKQKMYYDAVGNVQKIEELSSTGALLKSAGFIYDNNYRMTKVYTPDSDTGVPSIYANDYNYNYDALGNRQNENKANYQYDVSNKNRLTHTESVSYWAGHAGTIASDYTYDFKGNMLTKTYNKDYGICAIKTATGEILLALSGDVNPQGVIVIYDSNKFDVPIITLNNEHYEWNSIVEDATGSGLVCDGVPAKKMVKITPAKQNLNQKSPGTNNAAISLWYSATNTIPTFRVYSAAREKDTYKYDAENRLVEVNVDSRECSKYYYDESGMRIKKIENGVATIYVNHAGNPIYEESYAADSTCHIGGGEPGPGDGTKVPVKKTVGTTSVSTAVPETTAYSCVDTDNGINSEVKGTVTTINQQTGFATLNRTDQCIGNQVIEYSCPTAGSQSISSVAITCANGCSNGACTAIDLVQPIASGVSKIIEKVA